MVNLAKEDLTEYCFGKGINFAYITLPETIEDPVLSLNSPWGFVINSNQLLDLYDETSKK